MIRRAERRLKLDMKQRTLHVQVVRQSIKYDLHCSGPAVVGSMLEDL